MTGKLLVIGAGGFGRVVSELAIQKYDCAFVDDGEEVGTEICGVKVIGRVSDLPKLFDTYKLLVVTIGNNAVRERIYDTAEKIGYAFPNLIHSSAYVSPYAKMGWGCVLLNNSVVQNGSTVGNGVLLNPGVEVHHDCFDTIVKLQQFIGFGISQSIDTHYAVAHLEHRTHFFRPDAGTDPFQLLAQDGDVGGREVMRAHPELVHTIPAPPQEHFDIDTVADLAAAQQK